MLELIDILYVDGVAGSPPIFWPPLVGLGLIVGLFSGLLGVGGGFLTTPALSILGLPATACVGTSLAQMVVTSFVSAHKHFRLGNLYVKAGLIIAIPVVIGVFSGKQIMFMLTSVGVADETLRSLYLGFLCFLTYSLMKKPKAKPSAEEPVITASGKARWLSKIPGPSVDLGDGKSGRLGTLAVMGAIAGVGSGIMGIGGGTIMVPIMTSLLGLQPVRAVAISLMCVFFGSVVGTIGYAGADSVSWGAAVAVLGGSIIGSYYGASWAHRFSAQRLKNIFAGLLIMTALSIVLRKLDLTMASQMTLFIGALVLGIAALASMQPATTANAPDPEGSGASQ